MKAPISLHGQHVRIDAGICTGGNTPEFVGRRIFLVTLVDEDASELTDYVGLDRHAADASAVSLARDFGIRVLDLSGWEAGR